MKTPIKINETVWVEDAEGVERSAVVVDRRPVAPGYWQYQIRAERGPAFWVGEAFVAMVRRSK